MEPKGHQLQQLAFLWPALAAASAGDLAASFAQQFVDFAVGTEDGRAPREPQWATPNTIALELKTVRLRDFSTAQKGTPVLLCAPFALHGATVADFAVGHSLVAALRDSGLKRLFVTDWRSATSDMRYLGIDDYLADLNVLVDQLGGHVDLVGLCQGGWMSLLYAARFPAKIRKLVLAGAPIDIAAAPSGLSVLVDASPFAVFQELVKLGDGRVFGHRVLKFWAPQTLESGDIHQLLQSPEPIGSSAFADLEAEFRDWFAWTVDLPGNYYLEVVDRLYKRNGLASCQFVALGQTINLAKVRAPIFLLAARDDELVAPEQLFATEKLVGTVPQHIRKAVAPCRHLGLFMGMTILREHWTKIAHWIAKPELPKKISHNNSTMQSRR
ncbi:MAG: alpha/beta fold hydrolase [Methylomonas sp.]